MPDNQKETMSNFLQSKEWQEFQAAVGRKIFSIENVNIIEHKLPIVGKYFYIPRGLKMETGIREGKAEEKLQKIIELAKKNNIGWVRIDLENEESLSLIKNNIQDKIFKAPHDMQPKEIFVIDILKSKEDLLAEMKQKTRYNVHLAEKKNIKISISREKKCLDRFCELIKVTACRDKVSAHPDNYYRKMLEIIPEKILKLYCAEFEGKIIAANLVVFYETTAIYLHGASDNEHRNVMAPYLLQWQAILDAKNAGLKYYDFGGVKTSGGWGGITKFKLGFSPNIKPKQSFGSWDIILNKNKYFLYIILQKIKSFI